MKISKKLTAVLVTLGVVGMGVMAHAAPPVGKTVLQTYSCKRVNDCYTGVGTGKTGWIAAHDDLIRLYEIRSDGWVRGDYPAGSGRVTRWFRFGDLVMNGNFQNYEANLVNVKTAPVYRTHNSGSSFGTVYNTDKVIVVDEYGSRKCIVYNLDAGGYKMGWVDKNKVAAMSRVTNTTTSNPMINTSSVVRETSTQVSSAPVSTVNVSFVSKLPLQTNAVRKALCYQQPNGKQEGWIDQGDYVIVEQARSDGWVYGSYPVGSVRKKKWFRGSDLLSNANYKAQEMYAPASNTTVYRMSDMRTSLGSVYGNEKVTQVSVSGTNSQIIYKLDNGGYKMGWIQTNKLTAANRLANTTVSNPMINTSSGVRKTTTVYRGSDIAVKIYQIMGSNRYGSRWKGEGQCWGFAHQLYEDLFRQTCSLGSLNDSHNNIDLNYSGNIRKIGSVYNRNKDDIKNLFMQAKVGCYVQLARNRDNSNHTAGSPHSAIISSIGDTGVSFYEANVDWNNGIGDHWYSWQDLAVDNRGLAIYAPKDY